MEAYSELTETRYDSFDDLLAAEAAGWTVVVVIKATSAKGNERVWPYVMGPFDTKDEARKARTRLKYRYKKEEWKHPRQKAFFFLEPVWKDWTRRG
jgi:hypothetical protein